MIRAIDVLISLIFLICLLPVFIIVLILGYLETGSPIFIQSRLGQYQKEFNLIKFRTMQVGVPSVASHEIGGEYITKFGKYLRRTKIDELPQLINVIKGDMCLVGPRPSLNSQHDLIKYRANFNIYKYKPGITGLAQINHIDMSNPMLLAQIDHYMMSNFNLKLYFRILIDTALGRGNGDAIKNI
jgi:O-antigen biosynthesis protein WbqP